MPDWSASMQQTYEYYIVDPATWKDTKKLNTVLSCSISWDSEAETLGSAAIDVTESVGECYIRVYLITIQNGVREKHALGTFLVQTPSSSFDGKVKDISMDTYTPLLELKEGQPPLGYYIPKKANIMDEAYRLVREHARAPVVQAKCDTTVFTDFVADPSDTWIKFLQDFIANAKYKFALDELGRILFAPNQDTASLQPVWTYNVDERSILHADFSMDHDLYGIPNVVEVTYSDSNGFYHSRVINDDPNSPTSTIRRGREIIYRDTEPNLVGDLDQNQVDEYAKQLLRNLSTLEYSLTYTHGYCPVRIGDCVRINYPKAGIIDTKAKVISQTINCEPGCPVTEKAVFTTKLWR